MKKLHLNVGNRERAILMLLAYVLFLVYNRVNYYHSVDDCVGVSDSQAYNLKFFNTSGNRIYTFEVLGNKNQILATLDKSSETQIAKAEPTVKPKESSGKKRKRKIRRKLKLLK